MKRLLLLMLVPLIASAQLSKPKGGTGGGGAGGGTLDTIRAGYGIVATRTNDSVYTVRVDTTTVLPLHRLADSASALRTDLYRKSQMGLDSVSLKNGIAAVYATLVQRGLDTTRVKVIIADTASALRTDLYRKSSMGTDSVAQRNYSNSLYSGTSHNHTLDGLSNVLTTGKAAGNVLKWNGTAWVDSSDETGGGGGTLGSLTDVDTTGKADGKPLEWSASAGKWVPGIDNSAAGGGGGNLDTVFAGDGLGYQFLTDSTENMWVNFKALGGIKTTGDSLEIDTTDTFFFTQAEGNAKQAAGTYLIPSDTTNFRGFSNATYVLRADSATWLPTWTDILILGYIRGSDSATYFMPRAQITTALAGKQASGTYLIPSDTTNFRTFTNKTLQDSTAALRTDLYRKSTMGTDSVSIRNYTNKTLQDSASAFRTDFYRKSTMGTDSVAIRNYTNKTLQDSASAFRTDFYRKSTMGTDSTSIRNFTNKTLQDTASGHRTDLMRKDAFDDSSAAYRTVIEAGTADALVGINATEDTLFRVALSGLTLSGRTLTATGGTGTFGGLTDVDTTGKVVGSTVKWNGTKWVDSTDNSTAMTVTYFDTTGRATLGVGHRFELNGTRDTVKLKASDTTGLAANLAAKEAKATIRTMFRSGVMDSLAISDTISLGRVYPGATADTVIYDMARGGGVTVKLEMVDSLFQTVAGTKIDSSQCTTQVKKVVNTTALTIGKLIRMVITVVATEPKYFEATILAHH